MDLRLRWYIDVVKLSKSIINETLRTPQGEQAYKLCESLLDAGHEAWWVGGCVRDMALEQIPTDIDIATSATPDEIIAVFEKTDESAKELGSVLISLQGHVFEVTTFRQDHELSDGRFPTSVTFCGRASDAARRDITINALYWNPISSELWDPYEGLTDLNERLIRLIGDPETRIKHDALRLLRIIRFRALIDGQYHPDTFQALHRQAEIVTSLSGTRRFQELEKMLLGPHPEIAFEDLWETDVIEHLLPELHACKGVAQPNPPHKEGDVWNHMLLIIQSFTEDHGPDVRWAGLLHDIGKPETFSIEQDRIHFNEHASVGGKITKDLLNRIQCPGKRRDKIVWLVEHHMMMGTFATLTEARKAHWYYHPWFIDLMQLLWLDIAGTGIEDFSEYEHIVQDYNAFLDSHPRPKKPLLSGNEVMEILGIPPGERVGGILKDLHEAEMSGEISKKSEAIEYLSTIDQ